MFKITEGSWHLCSFACAALFLLTIPATATAAEAPLVLRGDLLFSEVEGSIFVAVDEWGPEGRSDRSTELLFVLQREPGAAFPAELPTQAMDAILYFDRQQLVVRGPELASDFVFTILDDAEALVADPLASAPFDATRNRKAEPDVRRSRVIYEGVGLIYQDGAGEPLFDSLQRMESKASALAEAVAAGPKLCPWGGDDEVDCWSGGCGATSCEGGCNITASCGVSCATGYFACCQCDWQGNGCKCYSNSECGC